MVKVSICIEMLFAEVDLYERPAKAAALGFPAVEFWGTQGKDLPRMKAACDEAGVVVAGFLGPAGVVMGEENPADKVVAAMQASVADSKALDAKTMIVTTGNTLEGVCPETQTDNIVNNLKAMAPVAEDAGLRLALESLNTLVDHVGYFLDHTADARAIVDRVDSPAVGLLSDAYHMQIMEGNLIDTIRANADVFNHVHVADVPGRFEPGTGEVNYVNVLKALDDAGYQGYCGFEFSPSDNSDAALTRAMAACGLA